jgi:hypothetical protein
VRQDSIAYLAVVQVADAQLRLDSLNLGALDGAGQLAEGRG